MEALEDERDEVFEKAAELFGVLSTPVRLRILSVLCSGEKNVGQLLESIDIAQPNMSQHLTSCTGLALWPSGVRARRCSTGSRMSLR